MESKRANQQITFEGGLVPSPMLFEGEQILGTFYGTKNFMEKKFIWILFFVFAILIICGCGKSQEDYKKAIELKGITYSIDNFIEQIKKGNKEVVELFVKAGIDVNAKSKDGSTALMYASSAKYAYSNKGERSNLSI